MEVVKDTFSIEGSSGRNIDADIRFPDGKEKYPCLIILHGFKAHKDWGFFPYISSEMGTQGFITITINFSHNGILDPEKNILDTEVFANNSVSREIEDIYILLKELKSNRIVDCHTDKNWDGRIFLLGHSMGGAISILTASERNDIEAVCLWGTIAKFNRYTKRQRDIWKKAGFIEFENTSTGQVLKLYSSFLEDLEKHDREFSLPDRIAMINAPIMILHGNQDMTVPIKEGQLLKDSAGENCEMKIIEKAGHVFGAEHPFAGTTRALDSLLDLTKKFFDRYK